MPAPAPETTSAKFTVTSRPLAADSVTSNESAVLVSPSELPSVTVGEEIDSVGVASSSAIASVTAAGSEISRTLLSTRPVTVTAPSGSSRASCTAVTVTAPALAVEPAATVSVFAALNAKSAPSVSAPADADTVTVTAAVEVLSSVAVTVETPPSEIDGDDSASVTRGVSSSVTVSVTCAGSAAPLPPADAPDTVTSLAGATAPLSTAVTVTRPVLAVAPAAMTSARLGLRVTAPAGAADTVTVTAALDSPDSVAVTVDTPPFSAIDASDSASVTTGVGSSSASVRVAPRGSATPLPPAAVAETVTDLSGEFTPLPFAVTVTAPTLTVAPAAMVSVFAALNAKSVPSAPAPGAAATVRITASLDAPDSVAVTVATPPDSGIDDGDNASAAAGVGSSSASARATASGPETVAELAAWPETSTCLFGESTSLSTAVTVTAPTLTVAPAAMVSVAGFDRLKSPSAAPVPAAADTVTVTAAPGTARFSTAVTVATPPDSEIDDDDDTSDTFGSPSSSKIVSVTSDGLATPLPPAAVPDTVTLRFAVAVVSLFTAVIVTSPTLAVEPAAMVRVRPALSVKSVPAPGAADTVTVTGSLAAPDSVAVTVATPPSSEIADGESASVAVGVASSSFTLAVTVVSASTFQGSAAPPALPGSSVTATSPSGWSTASSTACTATVCAVLQSPVVKVRVRDAAKAGLAPAPTRARPGLPLVTATVTSASGRFASATVNDSPAPPSATVTVVFDTMSPAASKFVVRAFAATVAALR